MEELKKEVMHGDKETFGKGRQGGK